MVGENDESNTISQSLFPTTILSCTPNFFLDLKKNGGQKNFDFYWVLNYRFSVTTAFTTILQYEYVVTTATVSHVENLLQNCFR